MGAQRGATFASLQSRTPPPGAVGFKRVRVAARAALGPHHTVRRRRVQLAGDLRRRRDRDPAVLLDRGAGAAVRTGFGCVGGAPIGASCALPATVPRFDGAFLPAWRVLLRRSSGARASLHARMRKCMRARMRASESACVRACSLACLHARVLPCMRASVHAFAHAWVLGRQRASVCGCICLCVCAYRRKMGLTIASVCVCVCINFPGSYLSAIHGPALVGPIMGASAFLHPGACDASDVSAVVSHGEST